MAIHDSCQNTLFALDCIFVIPRSNSLLGVYIWKYDEALSLVFGFSFNASYFYPVPKSGCISICQVIIHHQMRTRKPRGRRPSQEGTKWKLTKTTTEPLTSYFYDLAWCSVDHKTCCWVSEFVSDVVWFVFKFGKLNFHAISPSQ